jgi:hypothetical protein
MRRRADFSASKARVLTTFGNKACYQSRGQIVVLGLGFLREFTEGFTRTLTLGSIESYKRSFVNSPRRHL